MSDVRSAREFADALGAPHSAINDYVHQGLLSPLGVRRPGAKSFYDGGLVNLVVALAKVGLPVALALKIARDKRATFHQDGSVTISVEGEPSA
jgi:hypothetical protein